MQSLANLYSPFVPSPLLENVLADEVTLLIAYGYLNEAQETIDFALKRYPDSPRLLELRKELEEMENAIATRKVSNQSHCRLSALPRTANRVSPSISTSHHDASALAAPPPCLAANLSPHQISVACSPTLIRGACHESRCCSKTNPSIPAMPLLRRFNFCSCQPELPALRQR